MRGDLETGTDCHILTLGSSRDHSTISSSSWLGCSTVGRWGPNPSVWSWFSLRGHPISNCDWNWTGTDWLKPSVAPGYIIVLCLPASCGRTHRDQVQPRPQVKVIFRYLRPDAPVSQFPCLYTLVLLLIEHFLNISCFANHSFFFSDKVRIVPYGCNMNKISRTICLLNCTFFFCTTNVFDYFPNIMTGLELVKYKFSI